MKYLIYFLAFFLSTTFFAQENLILNPNFEEGSLPDGTTQVYRAAPWDSGCGLMSNGNITQFATLFDEDQEDNGFFCRLDVPANGFFINLPGKIGNRYAGFSVHGSAQDDFPQEYGRSLLAELSAPLTDACTYKFKMHIANRQRYYSWGGLQGSCVGDGFESNWEYSTINPNKVLEVVLRKTDNCDDGLTVLSFTLDNSTSWTAYEGTFTLSASDIAEGYDHLEIKRGVVSDALQIACDAVSLKIDPSATDLNPSFTGPTQFCAGDDMTFVGDDGAGTAQYTFWEIQETNQYGVPVEGGYNWYDWIPGTPGTFTFPEYVNPPCNRYYWIKMAVNNPCTPWAETLQIIHIGCNPKVPKGGIVYACRGGCITLADGFPQYPGITYQWFSNGAEIPNGNQLPLEVCPTAPEAYWLVATNNATGCASTTFFIVNIESLDPSWSHFENTSVSPYFYNISAVANDTDTESIPGFEYSWKVEKLNNELETFCEINNPECWSVHPLPTNFKSYNGGCVAGCSPSPQAGKFWYNRYYRITRTVWSDACGPQRQAKIFYSEDPRSTGEAPRVLVYEKNDSPFGIEEEWIVLKKENRSNDFSIFPNPNNGEVFQVNLASSTFENSTLELRITNLSGQIVHEEKLDNSSILNINLIDKLSNGIYLISLGDEHKQLTKRMIVQK